MRSIRPDTNIIQRRRTVIPLRLALRHAGLFGPGTVFPEDFDDDRLLATDPASGKARFLPVPGFGARLTNPINAVEHRFGKWTRAPDAEPTGPDQPASSGAQDRFNGATDRPIRYLTRRIGAAPGTDAPDKDFSTGDAFQPGRPATFNDRFANWIDSGGATAPLDPYQAASLPQDDRPRGLVSGEPMTYYPVPPPIFDFSDRSAPRGNEDDWLARLLRGLRSV